MRLIPLLITLFISGSIFGQPFSLPELSHPYDAYGVIDSKTMEIHHSKHHQGYVNKLNKAVIKEGLEKKALVDLMLYASYRSKAVRNNAGGHYNHTLFWELLNPSKVKASDEQVLKTQKSKLYKEILNQYGSLDNLKMELNKAAATRFGSGWAWLVVTPEKKLAVTSSPNQDNPIMDVSEVRGIPILGIDVWEHAYYLKYQNKRGDYLSAIWSILDWSVVANKYNLALTDPLLKTIEKEHWPELMHFHKVLAQTFHPAEKGNYNPIRYRSGELFAKAILLNTSEIPKPLLSPDISLGLIKLEKQCGSLDKCIRKNAKDKIVSKKIVLVHNTFHEIQGMCHDNK